MICNVEPKYLKLALDTEIADPVNEPFINIDKIKNSRRLREITDDNKERFHSSFVSWYLICIVDADGRVYTGKDFGIDDKPAEMLEDVKKYITPDCAIYIYHPECCTSAHEIFSERFNGKLNEIVSVQHTTDYIAAAASGGPSAGCIVING